MARPTIYRLSAGLSYGRSPVKLNASVPYDGLALPTIDSPIARNNRCTRSSGTKWYDLIQFHDSFHFAISERVKATLLAEKVSGWDSIALDVPEAPSPYHLFFPTSMAGPILNLDALNNYETELMAFDLGTWDGSDVFALRDTLNILITDRVRKLLEATKTTNMDLRAC